ncbi:MAG: alpha/beta hydrolase [Alphaproteobacteria bacterium]|nr:alpha/beta hydrolase [Alphaproteobacteria bacterium]
MSDDQHLFRFQGADGTSIATYRWPAVGRVKAVLQISHGMGEHAARYFEPLKPLREAGVEIYANDHRGHGKTAPTREALGDFGPGGFSAVVDDMARLSALARREHPGVPLILLGHSMGSFAAQIYLVTHSGLIDGAVLSGSAALDLLPPPDPNGAGLEVFNAPFEPARTKFDWLSRDAREVDKYIADPLCGFSMNASSMVSIFTAAAPLFETGALGRIRAELPIYVFSGDKDPLNGGLAWLTPLIERYRAAGIKDVSHDFYADGRHEMLNETNRAEVVAKLGAWVARVAAK